MSRNNVIPWAVLAAAAGISVCRAQSVDPRGPIAYPGMNVVADAQGVRTTGYDVFRHLVKKQSPWRAEWIWISGGQNPQVAMLRKEITLADEPRQVSAWMTADAKYKLYINGKLASRGPVDMGRDFAGGLTRRWFFDGRDLTAYFHKGANVIAAEVFRQWPAGPTVSRGQPGFLFEAEITQAGGDKLVVKSDSTWRGLPASQFSGVTSYDFGKEPAGWRLAGFKDADWPACQQVRNIWEPLIPSEIPPLMEANYPVLRVDGLPNRTLTGDATFHVVFDRVLSGLPALKVKGGKGAVLTIKAHHSASFVLGDGAQFIEFPFMTEIVPAYVVELRNVKSPVMIEDAGAVFTSQPVDYRGTFECSDDGLNRIWKVARWAVQICLQTHHLDSPNHQEPISDPGDYLIEAMVTHNAFAQPWLARQDIRKFAWLLKDEKYHNFHTSYSIGWLQMLMDYYDHTGDRALVEEMAPYVHELLDTYTSWRGRNGILCEAPNYMFMDWVNIGGFGLHHPPAVIGQGYLTAFYCHGLDMASRVAGMMGDRDRVAKYASLRKETEVAFNRELWNEKAGLYRDGKPFQTHVKPGKWLPADKNIETFSPHVNLLAVLYDLAPAANRQAIVEKVMKEKPLNTQPWFMHWVFQALDHAGLFDRYATPQLRRWHINPDTQSFREMWNGGDLSHGWCSTPLVQMSTRVLGITPSMPGFTAITIRPMLCDLTWAKGTVPTPLGDVAVSWSLGEGSLKLDVTVPDKATAEVIVPTDRFENARITLDGQPSEARVQVKAGAHHFVVTGALKPLPKEEASAGDSATDFESDVLAKGLQATCLASAEDHCSHAGGGNDTSALFNGTTRNGSGGEETKDDGKTFRGYGNGDWLVMRLKQPCDLTEIRTFAGHNDSRASQKYAVSVAYASAPEKYVPLTSGSVNRDNGSSKLSLPVQAKKVIAVRFDFKSGPEGFNVYREINLAGQPAR